MDANGQDDPAGECPLWLRHWFLNTGKKPLPAAPESIVYFEGNGANIIYIDWDKISVAVVRWIRGGDAADEFVAKMLGVHQMK